MDKKVMEKLQVIQQKNQAALEIIRKQKEERKILLSEIQETIPEQERNQILSDAEKDFLPEKEKFAKAKSEFDIALTKYNNVCDLLNYRIKNSFGKVKNQITLQGNLATVLRDGKSISVDVSDSKWQKKATAMIEQDLGITNGTARNIVYKISLMKKNQE